MEVIASNQATVLRLLSGSRGLVHSLMGVGHGGSLSWNLVVTININHPICLSPDTWFAFLTALGLRCCLLAP